MRVALDQTEKVQCRPGTSISYRSDIDGLRCIAILVVILFHIGAPFFSGGFVGVDVFFVISGYLIGSHVYRETRSGNFSLRRFYERRAKRILPAFFFVLSITYALSCFLLSPSELKHLSVQAIAALASCSNLYFWLREGYFAPKADANPLLMTWSLGVEEQFYLFFPLLMIMLKRLRPSRLILCIGLLTAGSFILAVYGVHRYPTATFYLLPTRAWEIGAGCILGIFEVEYPASYILRNRSSSTHLVALGSLIVLLGSCIFYSVATPFPGMAALLPVGAAVALIRTQDSWVNGVILSTKPMVLVGLISYSWYLWHWPLLSLAHICTGGPLSVTAGCLIGLMALLLSVLSYFAIEQPFRKTRKTGPRFLASYGIACLLFAAPAILLFKAQGWPNRFPKLIPIEAAAKLGSPDQCLADYGVKRLNTAAACMPAGEANKPGLALMGDSHASSLAYELRNKSLASGWTFSEFTKSSCPQLGSITRAMLSHPYHAQECAAYNKAALEYVLDHPNIHTVILAGYWSVAFPLRKGYGFIRLGETATGSSSQNWSNFQMGLEETVHQLRDHQKEVIIATDVPRFSADPLALTIGQAIPLRKVLGEVLTRSSSSSGTEFERDTISAEDLQANRILLQVAEDTGAQILNLSQGLCDGIFCKYSLNGTSLYVDQQHLTLLGAHTALQDAHLF